MSIPVKDQPIYCPRCKNRVKVTIVPDDGSNFLTRLFGKDGWHREFLCPVCDWTGRTRNKRDPKSKPKVGGGFAPKKHRSKPRQKRHSRTNSRKRRR